MTKAPSRAYARGSCAGQVGPEGFTALFERSSLREDRLPTRKSTAGCTFPLRFPLRELQAPRETGRLDIGSTVEPFRPEYSQLPSAHRVEARRDCPKRVFDSPCQAPAQ